MDEKLFYAIQANDVTTLRWQLRDGVSADTQFTGKVLPYGRQNRWSALHLCCEKGHYECAKELLEHGADPNSYDKWNLTPLAYAVQTQWHHLVDLLLAHGAEVNHPDRKGRTALHLCVEYTDAACVGQSQGMSDSAALMKKLISFGADSNIGDVLGRTPLWIAASEDGHLDQIAAILAGEKCDVNIQDIREKRTALQCAISNIRSRKDRMRYIRLLLEAGTDVNIRDARNHTAFMNVIWRTWSDGEAVGDEDKLICSLILKERKYEANAVCRKTNYIEYGGSALALAVERGACALVDMLLQYGADPDVSDIHQNSPLLLSAHRKKISCTAQLLYYNADMYVIGQVDLRGQSQHVNAFQCACHVGSEDIVMLLVQAGYDVKNEEYLWTNKNVPQYLIDNLNLWAYLRDFISCPQSLLNQCVQKIRSLFGKRIQNVKQMTIPTFLKGLILLENILGLWLK